jgi:putative CocE/NonD family hydrolase
MVGGISTGGQRLLSIEQVTVPMRDGTQLAADVHLPPNGPVPALLLRTPYDRQALRDRVTEIDPLLAASREYAVVIQDIRGRYASGGEFQAAVPDMEDGADTIAWIRQQRWCDGHVMMLGGSYDGCVQFQAARARPDGLTAIAPSVAGTVRTIWFPGGALRLAGIGGWMTMLLMDAVDREQDQAVRNQLSELLQASTLERFHACIEPGSLAWQIVQPLRHWVSSPPSDRYWTETTAVPAKPLPAVHTTGYYDLCLEAAVEAYAAWSRAEPAMPQLLTLGPWDHSLNAVYPDLGLALPLSPSAGVALERQLAFFDAMLGRGSLEELPAVMSFVLGRNRWHEGTQWPPKGVRPWMLDLSASADGEGRLADRDSGEQQTIGYTYDPRDPVPTRGGGHGVWGLTGPLEQASIESRADVLTFTSAPLRSEIELAGAPVARLLVSSSAPATDFIARLTLVQPNGRSLALTHGAWSGRLADLPAAGSGQRLCEISLGPLHIALAPGERLRLQVTSSCYPDLYPNPNTGHDLALGPPPSVQKADQKLLIGSEASRLQLPLLSGHAETALS